MTLLEVTLLVTAVCVTMAAKDSDSGVIAVAKCRSMCLTTFPSKKSTDEECSRKRCQTCWDTCEKIFSMSYADGMLSYCDFPFCSKACKVACAFKNATHETSPANKKNDTWSFAEIPSVVPQQERRKAYIAWSRPVLTNALPGVTSNTRRHFVYVLFSREGERDGNRAWTQMLQTTKTDAVLELDSIPFSAEFWLLAVLETGTVASKRFNSTKSLHWPFVKGTIPIAGTSSSRHMEGMIEYDHASTLNVSLAMNVVDGRLKPYLSWTNPEAYNGRSMGVIHYQVVLTINNCENCDLPSDYFSVIVKANGTHQPSKSYDHIVYHAEYHVKVVLLEEERWFAEMKLFTPPCDKTDPRDQTRCISETNKSYSPNIVQKTSTTPPRTTFETIHGTASPIVAQTGGDSNLDEWNITSTGMRYDSLAKRVFVDIEWSLPINQSGVTQELRWTNTWHDNHVDAGRHVIQNSTTTKHTLPLKPFSAYKVTVVATYTDKFLAQHEIRSRELELVTNVTDDMPHVRKAMSSSQEDQQEILNGIIIGVTAVAVLIVAAIVLQFIYKKRQSYQDAIITKSAVAKSNSYKSNVGCKVDFSNELLLTSDDWEIDCRQLKFASHIGQGAFGKVVTGYYEDQRVAIKLVRDCAPLSYKEDLLAEISLMKRIGSHPNIVSMMGACTLAEPICLVMEYVPYGNLQNFLKKCRLEGELTVEAGRSPELNYSMMDEHGGINEGVVTPADLLSFARQVAMAMEYLGDKKYVHRDLAARNVLLGFDKVIKVCDFGLSRDIFQDNQYKKITNGKLPLKWMAIESLRDRVFTTQSDVWSFGILLWEIVTMGASPYPSIALADLYYLLSHSYRMEKPSNCSDELYIIMQQCWLDTPTDRPNFTDLRVQLELLLSRNRNYLELDNINVPLSTPESSSGSPVSDDTKSLLAAQALQPQRKSSKDSHTVNVNIHDKNVERFLKRKSDFDAHNITIL